MSYRCFRASDVFVVGERSADGKKYLFKSCDIPATCLPGPTTPSPSSFDEFVSYVGDALAALWHVQEFMRGGRFEQQDASEEMAFASFMLLTPIAQRMMPGFLHSLRNIHRPNIPEFSGKAIPSFNEHAVKLC